MEKFALWTLLLFIIKFTFQEFVLELSFYKWLNLSFCIDSLKGGGGDDISKQFIFLEANE